MVSFTSTLAAAALAASAVMSTSNALEVGEYYRPSGDEVSGVYGTNATYHRSPCPALNSLANHGYLPRDGKNITSAVLKESIQSVYNLADDILAVLLAAVPSTFNLDYLSIHNALEHDASLAHTDAYFGHDPASVNETLAEDLFSRSLDGETLGITEVGAVRYDRLAECKANNPQCTFGTTQVTLAYLESSIFLMGFGGNNENTTLDLDIAKSFILEERIPEEYVAPAEAITYAEVRVVAAKLIAASV